MLTRAFSVLLRACNRWAARCGRKIFTLPRRGRMAGGGAAPRAAAGAAVLRVLSAGALDGAAVKAP